MKRIAIAVEDDLGLEGEVSMHFGRCSHYTFVEVEDGEISRFRVVGNPYYEAHTPGAVPNFIREEGADVMIGDTVIIHLDGNYSEVFSGDGQKIRLRIDPGKKKRDK